MNIFFNLPYSVPSKPSPTVTAASQVDLDPSGVVDEKAFARSSAFLKNIMASAHAAFQDSAESLCEILSDAMRKEVQANLNRPIEPRQSVVKEKTVTGTQTATSVSSPPHQLFPTNFGKSLLIVKVEEIRHCHLEG